MAHIKLVSVDAVVYRSTGNHYGFYWKNTIFKEFTDDHGNKTYSINGKECTKNDGNKLFLELKASNKEFVESKGRDTNKSWKVEITEEDVSYEELIKRCEARIDPYVEYIDDGKQYFDACRVNDEIRAEIEHYKQLIAQR